MCQIFMISKTENIKNLTKATETIANALQDTQQDGFGYAVLGKKGVFGERTTREVFKSRLNYGKSNIPLNLINVTHNSFGKVSEHMGAGIFHGRTSTNHKTLLNTHPIQRNNWTLIHNGVVTNHGPTYKKLTTNDTEDLVHYLSTEGIGGIEKNISGYYALGAIDPNGNLHIAKDNIASLYMTFSETLGAYVFATNEELIEDVCKTMKWKIEPIDEVKSNIYVVFNKEGELIEVTNVKPRGFGAKEAKHASRSLGKNIIDMTTKYDPYDLHNEYMGEEYSEYYTEQTDDYAAYADELERMDSSYKIVDYNGRTLTLNEFRQLDEITKRDCIVTRADGTVVDPLDYYTERLA